ncbi:MAG: hypothetical protein PHR77_21890, partial [Kiritimatiellae bacterium]|nr:hypothetical protein [Kiritimatiellia bacterium]
MTYSANTQLVVRTAVSRVLGILAVMILATILYLSTAGFPEWLAIRIKDEINSSGSVVLDAGVIRLAPLHMELVLEDVRLYRKKVMGPAAVDVKYLVVSLDLVALVKKKNCVRKIKAIDGTIRPKLCSGPDVAGGTGSGVTRKVAFVVELENCVIQGVNVVLLSADLHIEGNVVRFDNIGGTLNQGNMQGDLSGQMIYNDKTKVLDGYLQTQFDPRLLIPVINEWEMTGTADLISRFEFNHSSPKCEATFRKLNSGAGDFVLDGKFSIQDCSYQGVDMIRANGKVHVDLAGPKELIKVEVAELVRKEGVARTTFTVDLVRHVVTFDGMSEIHAPDFFRMVGVFTNECRQYFRFNGPVKIAASGVVDYGGLTNTNFKGIVETERMGIGPIMTEKCSFCMTMLGLTNTVTDVEGKMYGGKFSGSAVFVLPSQSVSNVSYLVDAKINDVDFKEVVTATVVEAKDLKYSGRLNAWTKVSGVMGEGNGRTV